MSALPTLLVTLMARTSIRVAYAARAPIADATALTRIADIGRILVAGRSLLALICHSKTSPRTELSL